VKNFVAQYCNLILYALRDLQPVKADECIDDEGNCTHKLPKVITAVESHDACYQCTLTIK